MINGVKKLKIISGGQTGADQAGLDAARELGLDYGGAIPRGRLTESGPLPACYDRMEELEVPDYPARTEKNVRDADVTLIFTRGELSGGTALTLDLAHRLAKPCLWINLRMESPHAAARSIRRWLDYLQPRVLNIAGSRESTAPGIYALVRRVLLLALRDGI